MNVLSCLCRTEGELIVRYFGLMITMVTESYNYAKHQFSYLDYIALFHKEKELHVIWISGPCLNLL